MIEHRHRGEKSQSSHSCSRYQVRLYLVIVLMAMTVLFPKEMQGQNKTRTKQTEKRYEEDWASLGAHQESPIWFKAAKLGIYFHWGVYTVPAFHTEWYPRNMHMKGHKVYKHHVEKYGHPSKFGYHDFVPMFNAEKFDADEWAELFLKAGAKFSGPVAEHHDGFSMWNSKVTPWNANDMGPKRDVTGELQKAITSRGMKFITTFHHSKQLQRSQQLNVENPNSHFPYLEGMPTSSDDPKLQMMYGNMPAERWHKEVWLAKLKEVIDQYQPDIIWFDYVLGDIPEKYRKEFAAYYLNKAIKWNKEVVLVRKQHDLPSSLSVEDLEQSRKNFIGTKPWMTDATLGYESWSYVENLTIRPAEDVLHMLIDITSKNGILLLNVSPRADGTIPENQKEALLKMGNWLSKYGESIYGTEAWYTFGEGPTKEPQGHFSFHKEFAKLKYTAQDIRYTVKDYNIYASVLGAVKPGQSLLLRAFAKKHIHDLVSIKSVSVLGNSELPHWEMTEEGLSITFPDRQQEEMATVIKVQISQ